MGSADWTDQIASAIDKHFEYSCCLRLRFKNKSIFAEGSCRECPFRLELVYVGEADDNILIELRVLNECDESLHKRDFKRKLRGSAREDCSKELQGFKPLQLYENIILEKGADNPNMPSIETLRKLSSQRRMSLKIADDEHFSLRSLFLSSEFSGIIKSIHSIPEYVNIFWHPEQESIVKASKDYVLMVDATGSIVQNPMKKEIQDMHESVGPQKPVYFYLAMFKEPGHQKSIPITQMISQSHTTKWTIEWLQLFREAVKNAPSEVRIDASPMLILAACKVYNNCDTNSYLKNCYLSIEQNKLLVKTLIRLDKSHVVKLMTRWKVWKLQNCDKNSKRLYISVLKMLISEDSFARLSDIIRHVITLILSEHETKYQIESLSVLKNYIGSSIDECENDADEFDSEDKQFDNIDEDFEDITWFDKIFERVSSNLKKIRIADEKTSSFFLPQLRNDLRRMMRIAPIWTNILFHLKQGMDRVSTSSAVESEFNTIKNNLLHSLKPPLRSDIFIQTYVRHIRAQCILFNSSKKKQGRMKSTTKIKHAANKIPNNDPTTC
jgi:hypothetical protein